MNSNNKRKEATCVGTVEDPPPCYKCQKCGHDVPLSNRTIHNLTYHKNDETVNGEANATTNNAPLNNQNDTNESTSYEQVIADDRDNVSNQAVNREPHDDTSMTAASPLSSLQSQTPTPAGAQVMEEPRPNSNSEQWSCPRCTLLNASTSPQCEACLYHRQLHRSGNTPISGGTNTQQQQPQQQPQMHLRTEVRQIDTRAVGSVVNVLSWAVLGAVFAGPPGALMGAATAAIIDTTTRLNNRLANQHREAEGIPHPSSGSGNLMISTTRLMPGAAPVMTSHSNRSNRQSMSVVGRNGMQIIITGPRGADMAQAERRVMQMLMMSAMSQGAENPDQLTFEELLQRFGVGTESRGASQETIDSLPVTKFDESAANELKDNEKTCNICLEDYKNGDDVKKLPLCSHGFHKTCIDQWLSRVASCPICKKELDSSAGAGEASGNNSQRHQHQTTGETSEQEQQNTISS